jgi:3-(3-hydroxy-phenyl)propionate hydroxylase
VLRKGADPKLIDTYESERKPHAKEMIDISVKMKDFVSLANPVLAKVRNVAVRTLLVTPKVGDYIREARFKPPPTYPNGAYFGLPRRRRNGPEGRPIPQPKVRTYDGRHALLDAILGEEFALVGYACDPRASLDAQTLARLSALGARFVALYPFGERPQGAGVSRSARTSDLVEVEDLGGEGIGWFRRAGARKGWAAVIRPDKFVYALTPAAEFARAANRVLAVYGDAASKLGALEPIVEEAGEKAALAV